MGFVGVDGHPNCVGPLKKPYHTLMPVMVTDSHSGDWMANIGCMGGYGQPQVNLQVGGVSNVSGSFQRYEF